VSAIAAIAIGASLILGGAGGVGVERRRARRSLRRARRVRRIAFPFAGESLSEPALVAALRIAHAEGATLVPVYLALVPRRLAVDVPLPGESTVALALLEAVEQRATRAGVSVDSRIERGRTLRHGLRELVAHEHYERMVVAAGADGYGDGFSPEDIAWLLAHAPGELVVLRPQGAEKPAAMPFLASSATV
jgi:hypothetical protein